MKKQPRKISYRFRVFLVYLLVAIVPIMLIIGVVENRYVRRLQENVTSSLDGDMSAVVDALDGTVDYIHSVVRSLILMKAAEKNYHPSKPVEAAELRDMLSIFVYDSTLFNEVALYSTDNAYLFSNNSSSTREMFWKNNGIVGATTEEVDVMLRETYGVTLLETQNSQNAFCAVYPLHNVGQQKALIFSISASKLSAKLKSAFGDNQGYCQLTDADGHVLFQYSTDGETPAKGVLMACAAGQRTVRDGMQTVYCAQGISEDTGLRISMVITGGAIHDTIQSMRVKWSVLIVSAIALCFVASWVTSVINTKPIVDLSKKLSSSKIRERDRYTNEIEHINASISHLNESAAKARKQMGELSDYLTFRLLCGTIENAENANQLTQVLGTSIYADAYQVCVVDLGQGLSASELRQKILSMLPPEISCLTRAFGNVFVCVFFCGLEDENAMDVLSEELLYHYPQGRMAFGTSYFRLEDIPLSFVEAYLATRSQESAVTAFAYSDAVSARIEDFRQVIRTNDLPRILASLQQLQQDMEAQTLAEDEAICICANVLHILSDSALAGRLADNLPNAYIIVSTESPELLKLLTPVIQELQTMVAEHTEIRQEPPLVEQMLDYLTANYRNADFSLQQMAFDFRLTPAMLSRYFKNHYGRNINDYLNDMKMERARKLLLETTLSVYEVGLELGYQGPNSFIRRFKATYGITPGEFRQDAQSEQ